MSGAPPAAGDVAAIEAFWLAYQRECGVKVAGFSAAALGRSATVADECAALVREGHKRAHATLARDFQQSLEPLPQVGDHLVVLDGRGLPRAIVQTTHVERRLFCDIDADFAATAGEGDGSLAWWLAAHRQDYAEQALREGFEASESLELILEFFERVWPVASPLRG